MLTFRAWELRTSRISNGNSTSHMPSFWFRHVERNMLYLSKQVVQWLVLVVFKYWLITKAKTKKWLSENWPKVSKYFNFKKKGDHYNGQANTMRISFAQRAIIESKLKIRKMREKIQEEHN
jgi:hypothetical protein